LVFFMWDGWPVGNVEVRQRSIDQSGTIQAAFADGLLLGILQIAGCASRKPLLDWRWGPMDSRTALPVDS
jgi:hypothetical protein